MTLVRLLYYTCDALHIWITHATRGLAVLVTLGALASADDVRPVQVQLREIEPNVFLVRWQVPVAIPPPASPAPVLPEDCAANSAVAVERQEDGSTFRQSFRCGSELSGRTLGIDYPFLNTNVSTVVRLSLLSGDEHARILAPGEDSWTLPQAPPDVLQIVRRGVLAGIEHVFDVVLLHFALILGFALVSRRLAGWFALGQVGSVALVGLGLSITPALSEMAVAIAVALSAREALRSPDERRPIESLMVAAGAVHGLGLAAAADGGAAMLLLAVVGMDATIVVLVAFAGLAARSPSLRVGLAYACGVTSVAIGLSVFGSEPAGADIERGSVLPSLSGGATSGGSRRIAPGAPDAPIQSFVAIEAFETRHEVLVRLRDVWQSAADVVTLEEQPAVKASVADRILRAAEVAIDDEVQQAHLDRVDFVIVDAQGVLPRSEPVEERVEDAFIGVTVAYLTSTMPQTMSVTWSSYDAVSSVPTTVIDPESTRTALLTADAPTIEWTNTLAEDPVPSVSAVRVEPNTAPLPLVSIALLAVAGWCAAKRRWRLTRIVLASAFVAAPVWPVAVPIPATSAPSAVDARRILASLLPNVYRAFEFRDESTAYDRLAVSVTGETLTDVYLEHRRALEMEERGGARARVEAVEVQSVDRVDPADDVGFDAVAQWTVGGTVTHFGHRHFRENRYEASVTVVPVADEWKIRAIAVVQEERVR